MSTDLILLEPKNPALVFVSNGCDPIIDHIKEEVRKEQPNLDISTAVGRKAIASLAYKIAGAKTKLDKIGLTLTNDQRLAIDAVNAERNRVWTELEKLQAEVRAPLTAWEKADEDRIALHECAIIELENLAKWDDLDIPNSSHIGSRLTEIPIKYDRDWQEFSARALMVKESVISSLNKQFESAVKIEAEAAELIRLRAEEQQRVDAWHDLHRQAQDDNIAFDAAAKAKKDAEDEAQRQADALAAKVEQDIAAAQKVIDDQAAALAKAAKDKKDAEEYAEQKRKEGHENRLTQLGRRALFDEEPTAAQVSARILNLTDFDGIDWQEFQQRAVDTKIKVVKTLSDLLADRQAAEEQAAVKKISDDNAATTRRTSDTTHKAKINNEVLKSLSEHTDSTQITMDALKAIITAIAQGKIPHVKISY